MTKEEQIDWVCRLRADLNNGVIFTPWKKEFTEALNKILEQGPKAEWIPANERLPEDRRTVLVTAYWHETYQVMEASYYGDGLWWCTPFNNCGDHLVKLTPKAWMELPEAYKESEGRYDRQGKSDLYSRGCQYAECSAKEKAKGRYMEHRRSCKSI